jgi:predicted  nucleic acid-binding Zn-ribbon protein
MRGVILMQPEKFNNNDTIEKLREEMQKNKTKIAVLESNVNVLKNDITKINKTLENINAKVDTGFTSIHEKVNKGFTSINNKNIFLLTSIIGTLIVAILNMLGVGAS